MTKKLVRSGLSVVTEQKVWSTSIPAQRTMSWRYGRIVIFVFCALCQFLPLMSERVAAQVQEQPAVKASSTALYNETYRPQFHFTPMGNWMNDPNGLVYYKGEYHLFYQYNPDLPVWGPMHWGHAVSTDLVHWTTLPIALSPDAQGAIWSGSVVVDEDNTSGFFPSGSGLVAIYTEAGTIHQQQGIAYSRDRGRTWTKYAGNPVIANPGVNDFRDPKVFWYAPTQRWIMIVAGGFIHIYSSPDLKHWRLESQLSTYTTECPDLFALPVDGNTHAMKWVLSMGGRQYYIGSFNGHMFTKSAGPFTIDFGPDFYAAQSWSDIPTADGRRIWLGWMDNWSYAQQTPTAPWRGTMTVPRVLTLKNFADGIRLVQTPVKELNLIHGQHLHFTNQTITPKRNVLASLHGDTLDIAATFKLGTAREFGFTVRVGVSQKTTIGYDVAKAQLFVDRSLSGVSRFNSLFAARYTAPLAPSKDTITLRILVDRSSVEVFGNNGEVVITAQIFPDAGSQGMSLYAVGGNVRVQALDISRMNTIWPEHRSALTNGDFHTGNLCGWKVISGTAFSNAAVTNLTSAVGGDGEPFSQSGTYHVWGFKAGGDALEGTMISQTVKLGGDGLIAFQTSGGDDIAHSYVALIRASDAKELFRETGRNSEMYRLVVWNAAAYIGTSVYLKVVDTATGGWGHINLADVLLPGKLQHKE